MKGFERGEPLSTFAKPPEPREQVTADDFMFALGKFTDEDTAETRREMRRCVEAIFARLDG